MFWRRGRRAGRTIPPWRHGGTSSWSRSAAVALDYRVTLVEDGHTTFATPVLSAPQIIAHHNHTLDGIVALAAAESVFA